MYDSKPWLAHYGRTPSTLDYPELSIFGMLKADAERHPGIAALEFMRRST